MSAPYAKHSSSKAHVVVVKSTQLSGPLVTQRRLDHFAQPCGAEEAWKERACKRTFRDARISRRAAGRSGRRERGIRSVPGASIPCRAGEDVAVPVPVAADEALGR